MKNTHWLLIAGLFFASCASSGYERTDEGVLIRLDQKESTDSRLVRLNVVNSKIIHVSATPKKSFSKEKSLIVVPQEDRKSVV